MNLSAPDNVLIRAIELATSECFDAMCIANDLAGSPPPAWVLVRHVGLVELVTEALDRRLDVKSIRAAVDGTPFCETKAYVQIAQEIGGRSDFPVV